MPPTLLSPLCPPPRSSTACRAFVSCGEARPDALTVGALPQEMHRSATLVQVSGGGGGGHPTLVRMMESKGE